jgi:hypothetical protein
LKSSLRAPRQTLLRDLAARLKDGSRAVRIAHSPGKDNPIAYRSPAIARSGKGSVILISIHLSLDCILHQTASDQSAASLIWMRLRGWVFNTAIPDLVMMSQRASSRKTELETPNWGGYLVRESRWTRATQ